MIDCFFFKVFCDLIAGCAAFLFGEVAGDLLRAFFCTVLATGACFAEFFLLPAVAALPLGEGDTLLLRVF